MALSEDDLVTLISLLTQSEMQTTFSYHRVTLTLNDKKVLGLRRNTATTTTAPQPSERISRLPSPTKKPMIFQSCFSRSIGPYRNNLLIVPAVPSPEPERSLYSSEPRSPRPAQRHWLIRMNGCRCCYSLTTVGKRRSFTFISL